MSKAEQAARNARARAVLDFITKQQAELQAAHVAMFLAFHDDSAWAQAKVKSGTVRHTAEGFTFLSNAVARRAEQKAYAAELDAELEKEKPVVKV